MNRLTAYLDRLTTNLYDGNFSQGTRKRGRAGIAAAVALALGVAYTPASMAAEVNSKIAFNSMRDGNDEIYVMNSNGSEQHRITYNATADALPVWSPDGKG